MNFDGVKALTFDCYGTLIHWERGIINVLQPLLRRHGVRTIDDEVLSLYGNFEREEELPPYKRYSEVLGNVVDRFAAHFGFLATAEERALLASTIADWQSFDDTAESLRRLQSRFRIGVLSNIDEDLFALSRPKLGIELDLLVTAERVQSYKPGHAHFETALRELGIERQELVHVGQSLYHDVAPTRELGIRNVWVNRRGDFCGATTTAAVTADLEVRTLEELARAAGC